MAAEQNMIRTMPKTHESDDPTLLYIMDKSLRLTPVQEKLIEFTSKHERSCMLGSADQLQLLANLCKYMNFKKTIDVGVFTGYSSLAIALALPPEGKVLACDVSEEYTNLAKPYWKEAGVADKVELVIAPAADTLRKRISEGESGQYDFAFIDADKEGYDTYYELCLELIRSGGFMAFDNVLWEGKVIDSSNNESATCAIRALNTKLATDPRVDISMLQIGDGTTLVFKK